MLPDQKVVKDVISLTLVGRGAVNYGTDFADNFVHLLENFAHLYPPQRPIEGQLWWNTSKFKLMVYTHEEWRQVTEDGTPEAIPDTLVRRDENADFRARIVTAALKGNADTATKWQTARSIILQGDVSGSAAIDGTTDAVINLHVSRSDTADRLSNARKFTWTGDATGELFFDGSADARAALTVSRAATADRISNSRQIALSKHVTGSGRFDGGTDLNIEATLNDTGVAPGSYNRVTVDRNGRVTAGTNEEAITRVPEADHAANADRATAADRADNASNADTAGTANRLATPRRISLTGKVTGAAMFDGSSDIEIVTSGADTPQGDDKTSATNIGSGQGHVFAGMSGPQLQFKTIQAGDNVSIVESGDMVRINSTAQISGTVDRAREADRATNADYAENAKRAEVADRATNVDVSAKSITNVAKVRRQDTVTINNPSTTDDAPTEVLSITMPNGGHSRIIRFWYRDTSEYIKQSIIQNQWNGSSWIECLVNGQPLFTNARDIDAVRMFTVLEGAPPPGTFLINPPGVVEFLDTTDRSGQQLDVKLRIHTINKGNSVFTFVDFYCHVIAFIK